MDPLNEPLAIVAFQSENALNKRCFSVKNLEFLAVDYREKNCNAIAMQERRFGCGIFLKIDNRKPTVAICTIDIYVSIAVRTKIIESNKQFVNGSMRRNN